LMKKLHEANPPVIFRDLKPSNLMLTPQHDFFLIDFGIARNYQPGKVKDTTPLGSPGFAPPEQYGRAQTDERSDVYSLGATLQTMLTGRDPQELRAGEPTLNPHPPTRAMRKLLDDMLSPNSTERPWSMTRVEARLEEIQNQVQWLRSYWLGLISAAFVGIFLAVFIISNFQENWVVSLIFITAMLSRGATRNLRQRLGIRTISQNHLWYGILTGMVPVLILLIWRIWPF
jgi:serine/threonine protein kinase